MPFGGIFPRVWLRRYAMANTAGDRSGGQETGANWRTTGARGSARRRARHIRTGSRDREGHRSAASTPPRDRISQVSANDRPRSPPASRRAPRAGQQLYAQDPEDQPLALPASPVHPAVHPDQQLVDQPRRALQGATLHARGGCGSAVHQRAGRGQDVAALQPRLQAGEDHRPAAVELLVCFLAQLIVGDGEPARVGDRLDLPGDP